MSDPVEQLIERLRRNASGLQEGLSGRLMRQAADALARQREEIAGMKADMAGHIHIATEYANDAERYRKLREYRPDYMTVQSTCVGCIGTTLDGDELDAAVDKMPSSTH